MNRLISVLAAVIVSACAGGARNVSSPEVYDFGMPPARLAGEGAGPRVALDVKAPVWIGSTYIDYRLAYDDPLKRRHYTNSRWAGEPALLLGQRLRQQLGAASPTGNTVADCLLRVELQEFSQVFASPGQSNGVVQGVASLIDAKRQVVAEHSISIEQPAPSADARGGVSALAAASDELGRQLGSWLASSGACRPPQTARP